MQPELGTHRAPTKRATPPPPPPRVTPAAALRRLMRRKPTVRQFLGKAPPTPVPVYDVRPALHDPSLRNPVLENHCSAIRTMHLEACACSAL